MFIKAKQNKFNILKYKVVRFFLSVNYKTDCVLHLKQSSNRCLDCFKLFLPFLILTNTEPIDSMGAVTSINIREH